MNSNNRIDYSELSKRNKQLAAKTQGGIFEEAASCGCDMDDFMNKYLTSRFCNQEMDAIGSSLIDGAGKIRFHVWQDSSGITFKTAAEPENPSVARLAGEVMRYLVYNTGRHSMEYAGRFSYDKLVAETSMLDMHGDMDAVTKRLEKAAGY